MCRCRYRCIHVLSVNGSNCYFFSIGGLGQQTANLGGGLGGGLFNKNQLGGGLQTGGLGTGLGGRVFTRLQITDKFFNVSGQCPCLHTRALACISILMQYS